MQIHLRCPRCPCHFAADADTPRPEVLDRMTEDAPWFALAEGDTFEDMVLAALGRRGKILCPECRGEVVVSGDGRVDPADLRRRRSSAPLDGPSQV